MRTKCFGLVAALLLVTSGAMAQDAKTATDPVQKDVPKQAVIVETIPDIGIVNSIDFGVRGTNYAPGSDVARYQRYQDMRNGATLDRFRFSKTTDEYLFRAQADNVGYDDQRFSVGYNRYGKVKAAFEWNDTPLNYSKTTQTLYNASDGVLTLSDATQSAIQNKTLTLANAVSTAPTFYMQSKRSVADFNLSYEAARDVALVVTFKNTLRNGTQPYAAGFGFGGATDELGVPIDHRTTEVGTKLEFNNRTGYARVAYEGSFFRNNITTLTWDNPLRVSDSASLPAAGRESLWPNTDQNTVSVSGGLNQLPGRSHANAFISVGQQSNNDPLIPWTINSALPSPALPRTNAEVQARVTAMNFSFTSRPLNQIWFNARYRQYQFDNRTPVFAYNQSVAYDASLVNTPGATEPLGYTRHTFDSDLSYSPLTFLGIRGGYTREEVDRTFRWIEKTTEDIARVSADLTGTTWLSVRGVYEYGKRRAAQSIDPAEILADGEQPALGQYDIANRNRDRFSAIVTVTPLSMLSFNGSAAVGKDEYPGYSFGLRSADSHVYSVGFDLVPIDNKMIFGASLGREKYSNVQASRFAAHVTSGFPPTFFNPLYDWSDTGADSVYTVNVSADLLKVITRTDVRASYDYSDSKATYTYGLAPGSPMATPNPLSPVTNTMHRATVDGRYYVTRHVAVGAVYWFDKYDVSDFALGPQPAGLAVPAANPSIMMVGYYYRPYTANTVMGRFTYLW